MLVLTRSPDLGKNTIIIGDDIHVVITKVRGNQVRIGLEVPPHMTVLRGEVTDRRIVESRGSRVQSRELSVQS